MARQRKAQDNTASEPAQRGTGASYAVKHQTSSIGTETIDVRLHYLNFEKLPDTEKYQWLHDHNLQFNLFCFFNHGITANWSVDKNGRKETRLFCCPLFVGNSTQGRKASSFWKWSCVVPGIFKISSCMLECVESRNVSREMYWKKSRWCRFMPESSFWCNVLQLISASLGSVAVSCSFDSICRGSLGANKLDCSATACFCPWSFQGACWALAY